MAEGAGGGAASAAIRQGGASLASVPSTTCEIGSRRVGWVAQTSAPAGRTLFHRGRVLAPARCGRQRTGKLAMSAARRCATAVMSGAATAGVMTGTDGTRIER